MEQQAKKGKSKKKKKDMKKLYDSAACVLLVPTGHHGTSPALWPAAGYTAVSIPYFYPARPQKALPLKGGAHILIYVYQFQGGLLK